MPSKKTIERLKERELKREEDIKAGKLIRIPYQEKKRKNAQPNRKSSESTPQEELENRQQTVEDVTKIYAQFMPTLLNRLSKIEDPRQAVKVKHKITVLMVYGILLFVYQVGSRRNANKKLTTPIFLSNIKAIFPEFETTPHADTLNRLLEDIDVEKIQEAMIYLLKSLIKKKKFKKLLINGKYLIAVDGSQKFFKNYQWQDEALKRTVGTEVKKSQFYVYVLDSVLVLDNGMVLPIISEILENTDWIEGETKQDCERNAFKRLAIKLRNIFGKGSVILVGDGLYACGPVMKTCMEYKWDFMLTLKEDALKDIWKEATGLMRLEPGNSHEVRWGERDQGYQWANGIEYEFGTRKKDIIVVSVVICKEYWQENHIRSTKLIENMETKYAWISSKKLTKNNVFQRCTKIARYRWKIENNFLTEKHQGYFFEHCYSYNWNAMKGFHYLMKIGHFVNALLIHSEIICGYIDESGIQPFFEKLFLYLRGAELDTDSIASCRKNKIMWKLKIA